MLVKVSTGVGPLLSAGQLNPMLATKLLVPTRQTSFPKHLNLYGIYADLKKKKMPVTSLFSDTSSPLAWVAAKTFPTPMTLELSLSCP